MGDRLLGCWAIGWLALSSYIKLQQTTYAKAMYPFMPNSNTSDLSIWFKLCSPTPCFFEGGGDDAQVLTADLGKGRGDESFRQTCQVVQVEILCLAEFGEEFFGEARSA
jgi:hypothetical protein